MLWSDQIRDFASVLRIANDDKGTKRGQAVVGQFTAAQLAELPSQLLFNFWYGIGIPGD